MACVSTILALCLLPDVAPLYAAQSAAQKQSTQKQAGARKRAAQSAPVAAAAETAVPASNVYAQDPFTEKELIRFIESMPLFLAWARGSKAKAHPMMNAAGKPDFAYTQEAAAKAAELGWEPRRFFCLLGKAAAALYLVEEGTDRMQALQTLPPDMPIVTETEMAFVRKHLASLLRAGAGGPQPVLSR
jgi:hypothetical protein